VTHQPSAAEDLFFAQRQTTNPEQYSCLSALLGVLGVLGG
jgi:hypothetical protein